jgi:hypothetical protein
MAAKHINVIMKFHWDVLVQEVSLWNTKDMEYLLQQIYNRLLMDLLYVPSIYSAKLMDNLGL